MLFEAIEKGNWSVFKSLLDDGTAINARDAQGRTPLMAAAGWQEAEDGDEGCDRSGRVHVAGPEFGLALVEAGVDIHAADKCGRTALIGAVAHQVKPTLVHALLEAGVDVNVALPDGATPLMIACLHRQSAFVELLIDVGASVDLQDKNGKSALFYAARHGCLDCGRALTKAGVDVNVALPNGATPLMIACLHRQSAFVAWLIDVGASVDLQDKDGWSALSYAAHSGCLDCGRALTKAGVDVNAANFHGATPLMIACLLRQSSFVAWLIHVGASVDLQDKDGCSALSDAVLGRCPFCARALINAGTRVEVSRFHDGYTALHFIAVFGTCEFLPGVGDLLLMRGLGVDTVDASGRTPLFEAAQVGHLCVVKWLLQAGADPARANLVGQDPAAVAKLQGHQKIAALISNATPGAFQRLARILSSSDACPLLAIGAAVGCGLAVATHLVRDGVHHRAIIPAEAGELIQAEDDESRLQWECECAHDHARDAMRRAQGNEKVKMARSCLELVAVVWFPLGSAMLVAKPTVFFPMYVCIYILPAVAQVGWAAACQRPGLLLAGASPLGPCAAWRDARLPRLAASVFLLWAVAEYQNHCVAENLYLFGVWGHSDRDAEFYRIKNGSRAHIADDHVLTYALLFSPVPLLGPGGSLVCGRTNEMSAKDAFHMYLDSLWWLTLLNFTVTAIEIVSSVFTTAKPSLVGSIIQEKRLAEIIATAQTKSELDAVDGDSLGLPGLKVKTVQFNLCTFPPSGGMWQKAAVSGLDVFLDGYQIYIQVMTYNPKFAVCMVAITTSSLFRELLAPSVSSLRHDFEESRKKGLTWGAFHALLEIEVGWEAPLSFALTAYAFPFSITDDSAASFVLSMLSMLLSLYGLAEFVVSRADSRIE